MNLKITEKRSGNTVAQQGGENSKQIGLQLAKLNEKFLLNLAKKMKSKIYFKPGISLHHP